MTALDFFQAIDAKLNRVPEKIKAIKVHSDTYIAENPPQIVMDGDGKATLDMSVPVPPVISVIVGEILYQLRSTLDHLAFRLVKLNPSRASMPKDWEELCQFPLMLRLKVGQVAPLPLGCFIHLPNISIKAHTFIESVQPYYPTGKVNNCLRFLKELSNQDKHRYLALTRSRSQVHENRLWTNGTISTGYISRDHGAEIDLFPDRSFGSDSNVQMSFKVSGFIAFNEPILGGASDVPIEQLLHWLLESVRDEILPTFKLLIENP
jgi:hypothetical protein